MNYNPGVEIIFEGNTFRYCQDTTHPKFDTYVLKSKGNIMKFQKEGFIANIITVKFPNNLYGFGYSGTAIRDSQQCYCHGVPGHITFKNEFEAKCAAINFILKNKITSGWHQHFIKLQMTEFVNPKTLF